MKTIVASTVLTVFFACSPALSQEWASRMFPVKQHDFGVIAPGSLARFEFPMQNLYGEDVHIASVRASCGCTSVEIKNNKRLLRKGEKSAILARISTSNSMGPVGATITVRIDKPTPAEVQLHVKGFVRESVAFRPSSLRLGSIKKGTVLERTVQIIRPGQMKVQFVTVDSPNPHLVAELVESSDDLGRTSQELHVRLDGDTPAGHMKEYLILLAADGTRVPFSVQGYVLPNLSISPRRLFMGVVPSGQTVVKNVVIRGNSDFRITRLAPSETDLQFDLSGEHEPRSVHVVPVTFVAGRQAGRVERTVHVETSQETSSTTFSVTAIVEAPTTSLAATASGGRGMTAGTPVSRPSAR